MVFQEFSTFQDSRTSAYPTETSCEFIHNQVPQHRQWNAPCRISPASVDVVFLPLSMELIYLAA
jgi:hypothetical protein